MRLDRKCSVIDSPGSKMQYMLIVRRVAVECH
jgi:hypothetical protein